MEHINLFKKKHITTEKEQIEFCCDPLNLKIMTGWFIMTYFNKILKHELNKSKFTEYLLEPICLSNTLK